MAWTFQSAGRVQETAAPSSRRAVLPACFGAVFHDVCTGLQGLQLELPSRFSFRGYSRCSRLAQVQAAEWASVATQLRVTGSALLPDGDTGWAVYPPPHPSLGRAAGHDPAPPAAHHGGGVASAAAAAPLEVLGRAAAVATASGCDVPGAEEVLFSLACPLPGPPQLRLCLQRSPYEAWR